MKKIMFNDAHLLNDMVLRKQKTMTRRLAKYRGNKEVGYYSWPRGMVVGYGQYCFIECLDANEEHFEPEIYIRSEYHVGEVVAVAQSYRSLSSDDNPLFLLGDEIGDTGKTEVICSKDTAGWNNKMFVKADYMPHHIRITGIKAEMLQEISEEDMLKEGILQSRGRFLHYQPKKPNWLAFNTPVAAFHSLIDRVSGKGTWDENPLVFAYEYELID